MTLWSRQIRVAAGLSRPYRVSRCATMAVTAGGRYAIASTMVPDYLSTRADYDPRQPTPVTQPPPPPGPPPLGSPPPLGPRESLSSLR